MYTHTISFNTRRHGDGAFASGFRHGDATTFFNRTIFPASVGCARKLALVVQA